MLYNILIVDDDKRSADGLANMIGVLGHTVVVSYGPRMALQQLNEVIPDVIFLDINMPGVTGLEVLRYLRRDPYTEKVPVVIVSANDTDEDKRQALAAGANYYIVKPPHLEEIEVVLDKLIKPPKGDSAASKPDTAAPKPDAASKSKPKPKSSKKRPSARKPGSSAPKSARDS